MRAAVLGSPISHSLSPHLHRYWLHQYALIGDYEAIDTLPENLAEKLKFLADSGYCGVNLTVPLKEQVMPLLADISETAQHIGAVNTLCFTPKGYYGDNTDAFGFVQNLRQKAGDLTPYLPQAVVLGAGGAARAAVVSLLQAGAHRITLINRNLARAESLALLAPSQITVQPWDRRDSVLKEASLLVNTTALGMQNKPALELNIDALPLSALVYDIVYNPLITPLLKQAQQRGNAIVDGLGMLIWQAVPAFEAFYGQRPAVDVGLHQHLLGVLAR